MTEQENKNLIVFCRIEIRRWENAADKQYGALMVQLMKIALAFLTEAPEQNLRSEVMRSNKEQKCTGRRGYGV